tara:strand:- start:439 stop:576 length:138 start_codon:yes stop_codon:yes gene_type:complete
LPFDSFGRDATGVVHETIFAKFDMFSPLPKMSADSSFCEKTGSKK